MYYSFKTLSKSSLQALQERKEVTAILLTTAHCLLTFCNRSQSENDIRDKTLADLYQCQKKMSNVCL